MTTEDHKKFQKDRSTHSNTRLRPQMSNFDAECRICQEGGSDMSPLVSPCACRGGSKYVHLECLQQWAGTKDDEEQERQVAWKRGTAYVECITCKQEFFGETAVALGREALLRTTARHQRATAESADSFERTQLDMAESLSNLAQLLKVQGSTTRSRC